MGNSKAVVKKGDTLPAIANFGDMAGVGKAEIQDQVLVPFLSVLQDLTPTVKSDDFPTHKAGAMLNTGSDIVTPRGETLLGVPCAVKHCFVQWKARNAGGGLVSTFAIDDPFVTNVLAGNPNRYGKLLIPEGMEGYNADPKLCDELAETFYVMFGLVSEFENPEFDGAVVLSFSKSKIKKWRAYVTKIEGFKGSDGVPIFGNVARIGTVLETKNADSWWNFEILPAVEIDGTPSAPHSVPDMDNPAWQAIVAKANDYYTREKAGEVAPDQTKAEAPATATVATDPI